MMTYPLEAGDRLTRDEFERRYNAMPHLKKAELVEGVVYLEPEVRYAHGRSLAWLAFVTGYYSGFTPGTESYILASVRIDPNNEFQPDVLLRIEKSCDGQSRLDPDDFVEGSPELIIEVTSSSASYEFHDKLNVCQRSGVQEYVVWRVRDKQLDWFQLHEGHYLRQTPDARGILISRVFPGLRLDAHALLAGDLAGVLTELQRGLKSAAHKTFVRHLAAQKRRHQSQRPARKTRGRKKR